MGGLNEKNNFFLVSSLHREITLFFFYETEIVRFSAITTKHFHI